MPDSWPHAASSRRKPALICSTPAAGKPNPSLCDCARPPVAALLGESPQTQTGAVNGLYEFSAPYQTCSFNDITPNCRHYIAPEPGADRRHVQVQQRVLQVGQLCLESSRGRRAGEEQLHGALQALRWVRGVDMTLAW